MMAQPKALIVTGYGINCDEETHFAFQQAGAQAKTVHINDLIDRKESLQKYQILSFPGGFSFGDDTGSGNGLANKIRNHLWDEIRRFVEEDHLVMGICNGFQVLVRLGLLPALNNQYGKQHISLVHNDNARYTVRWVDLQCSGKSPRIQNIDRLSSPIAHGEGKLYAPSITLQEMQRKNLIAARYVSGEICALQRLAHNPNGSLDDIAALTDESGRVLGIMPHPERARAFTQLPHWTLLREQYLRNNLPLPEEGPGLQIFKNGVGYFA